MRRWNCRLLLGVGAMSMMLATGCGHVSRYGLWSSDGYESHESVGVSEQPACSSCAASHKEYHAEEQYHAHEQYHTQADTIGIEPPMLHSRPGYNAMPQGVITETAPPNIVTEMPPTQVIQTEPIPSNAKIMPMPPVTLQDPPQPKVPPMPRVNQNAAPSIEGPDLPLPTPEKSAKADGWKASSSTKQVSYNEVVPTSEPAPLPLRIYDHARNYSWLVGTMEPGRQAGTWCVRFCSMTEENRFGGSVTLVDVGESDSFHFGQPVRVEGELVDPDATTLKPAYKARTITLLK